MITSVCATHCDGLAPWPGSTPVPINPDRYEEFVLECELRYVDFHISRGVFVPMSDEELDEISGKNNDEDEE